MIGAPLLLIMAAGTGGHIMPGLAIARIMQARGWQVHWLGTRTGMENRLVPAASLPLHTLEFSGLRGKGWRHTLCGAWRLVRGLFDSAALIGRLRPAVVLGMGGYVTVPGGLGAVLRRTPLVLMNSDAELLLSNRLLLPFARHILFGLPGKTIRRHARARWTGAPVRAEIVELPPPAERFGARTGRLRLLVVGGSLGATVLNRVVPEALALLPHDRRPVVTHQCGVDHVAEVTAHYRKLALDAEVVAFIDDMPRRYAEVDLVICRAGAMTVMELTVAGVPALLVPLVVSTTHHQVDNARYMEDAGAALHIAQTDLTAPRLAALLEDLTRPRLLAMANAARALGRPEAGNEVGDLLDGLARRPA